MADSVVEQIPQTGRPARRRLFLEWPPSRGAGRSSAAIRRIGALDGVVDNAGIVCDSALDAISGRQLGCRTQGRSRGGIEVARAACPPAGAKARPGRDGDVAQRPVRQHRSGQLPQVTMCWRSWRAPSPARPTPHGVRRGTDSPASIRGCLARFCLGSWLPFFPSRYLANPNGNRKQ